MKTDNLNVYSVSNLSLDLQRGNTIHEPPEKKPVYLLLLLLFLDLNCSEVEIKKDNYLKSKRTAFLPDIRRINSYNTIDTVFVGTETGIKIIIINEDQNEEDQIGFSIRTIDPDYTVGNGSTIEDVFFSAQQLSGDSISSQMISQQGGNPNNFIVERQFLFELNKIIELNIKRKSHNVTTTEIQALPMIEGITQEIVLYY